MRKDGTCKWFDKYRGFGFLIGEDNKDYFVHYSQILTDGYKGLDEGDIVSFEVGMSPDNKRIQAVKVFPIITLTMVEEELAAKGLYVHETDGCGMYRAWYIVDSFGVSKFGKHKMCLEKMAAYVGI